MTSLKRINMNMASIIWWHRQTGGGNEAEMR